MHFGAKGVYRQMSCQGILILKSAVLFKLLAETIEAPKNKKRNRTVRETNTQKEKAENDNSE